MSTDPEDPRLVAYRLGALEKKVDDLHLKFDSFRDSVAGKLCPNPGACVQLQHIVERLDGQQEKQEARLIDVEKEQREAKSFIKGAVFIAGAVGSVIGLIGPAVFAGLKAVFLGKP